MKRTFPLLALLALSAANSIAALPTLSGLADAIEELRGGIQSRLAETSNRLAEATAEIAGLRARLDTSDSFRDSVVVVIEGDQGLRERFHGGRLGQYVLTNESGRIIRVDLYADGNVWTNNAAALRFADPEARAKELARLAEERERIQAAWEAANLPPDLAALRAAQRERDRQNSSED